MKNVNKILDKLEEIYPDAQCELNYETPFELLIATILSAQCTDVRVNKVTEVLFKKYNTPEQFAALTEEEIGEEIRSCGLYKSKSKKIKESSRMICENFGGEVPQTLKELTTLPGVGRKTANVIRGNIFHEPSVVVDTHVKRISRRLGFTKEEDPVKIEYDLMRVLPREHWILYNIQIITFGRQICFARNPKCEECFLTKYCKEYKERKKKGDKA